MMQINYFATIVQYDSILYIEDENGKKVRLELPANVTLAGRIVRRLLADYVAQTEGLHEKVRKALQANIELKEVGEWRDPREGSSRRRT